MPWNKPKVKIAMGGLDAKKDLNQEDIGCPWTADCPQYVYITAFGGTEDRDVPLSAQIEMIEDVQPRVRLYRCKRCGRKFLWGIEGHKVPEESQAHLQNPAFIGGGKVI